MDFMNGYGGYTSLDDEVCLVQTFDGTPPVDLPVFDDDDDE